MENKRNRPASAPGMNIGNPPNLNFRGIARPSDDFGAIVNDLRSPPLGYVIDLTNARSVAAGTQIVLGIAGNAFYVDGGLDVGNASIRFQDTKLENDQPPMFVGAQFIARVPFSRIIFENTAQPGKVLRFFYGVDIDFVPGLSQTIGSIGVLGSITDAVKISDFDGARIDAHNVLNSVMDDADGLLLVRELGYRPSATYASVTALAANTPQNFLAAASNTLGLIVYNAQMDSYPAGATGVSLCMNAGAPGSIVSGTVIHMATLSASGGRGNNMPRSVAAASGLRLDFISTAASGSALILSCHYGLLT